MCCSWSQLSSAWDQPMGSLVLPVRELLSEPQLVLDQWFHLDGASPESQILLRAELKVRREKNPTIYIQTSIVPFYFESTSLGCL